MSETLRERVARAICGAYGDEYDEQPPDLATLRQWRGREGARDADGNGIVRAYDSGLPTQADWLECADAAIAVIREHLQSEAAVERGRQALLAALAGSPYAKDAARAVIAAALGGDRD